MFYNDIETERLILKNISYNDRDFILSQFSDEIVNKYLYDTEPIVDIQGADEIIDIYLRTESDLQHRWILIRKDDNVKMGTCGFHCWNKESNCVGIGYDLKAEYWNNGYMQEAMKEIISFAKNAMKIKKIDACISVENNKSIALIERIDFVFAGEMKDEIFRGVKYPHKIFSLNL